MSISLERKALTVTLYRLVFLRLSSNIEFGTRGSEVQSINPPNAVPKSHQYRSKDRDAIVTF
jgi:hypothetical protein